MALFKILRGNSSKLIQSNGAINSETKWTDGYAYYCTDTHDFYIDHLDGAGIQVRSKLNAKEAEKLRTSRSIAAGGAVTSTATSFDGTADITIPINSVKEAYLTWGGKSLDNAMSPIDGTILDGAYNNVAAFFPSNKITMQQSTDGSTWAQVHTSKNKSNLTVNSSDAHDYSFSQSYFEIIFDNTDVMYGTVNKIAIEGTISGGTGAVVLYGQKPNASTWEALTEQTSMASTGTLNWTILNIGKKVVAGWTDNTSHYKKLKLSFYAAGIKSIRHIYMYGFKIRNAPSNLGLYGQLYTYDSSQNTTFPNSITQNSTTGQIYSKGTLKVDGATTLTGAVTSGALTASSLTSNGALTVTGAITANGNVTLGNSSTADTTTLTSKLVANGTSNFKAAMTATSITASGKVTSSEFVGDLTGTADEAISLTWAYFNDSGIIS